MPSDTLNLEVKRTKSFVKTVGSVGKLPSPLVYFAVFAVGLSVILLSTFAANPSGNSSEQILFASKEGSTSNQLWIMNSDGTGKSRLTNDQNSEQEWARPSPDGKTILFMKAAKGSSVNFALESNELWLMDSNGANQRPIITKAKRDQYGWKGMGHAEWSPDSSRIVLVATLPNFTAQLFVVDKAGNNKEQITQTTTIDGQSANVLDPSWSSTNQIVYVRQWSCFFVCANQDVFSMDYATRKETRVTNDPGWNFDPYLSPDGTTFLWLSFRSSAVSCPCDLIRGNAKGNLSPQPVIADGGANANGTFSRDGRQIAFLKTIGLKQVLHVINLDGTGLRSLAPTAAGESGIGSFVYFSSTQGSNAPAATVANPSIRDSAQSNAVSATGSASPVMTNEATAPNQSTSSTDLPIASEDSQAMSRSWNYGLLGMMILVSCVGTVIIIVRKKRSRNKQ